MNAADLDEWRSALEDMTATERTTNCGHTSRNQHGICIHCGDQADV